MGRSVRYRWHDFGNWKDDVDCFFDAKDAEYFFYKEHRVRDQRYKQAMEYRDQQQQLVDGAPPVGCSINLLKMRSQKNYIEDLQKKLNKAVEKFNRGK